MTRKSGIENNTLKNNEPVSNTKGQENGLNSKIRYKTLIINSEKYRTTLTKKFENRKKWIEPDNKEIISFMPCTIIKVFVKEGQNVKKNDEMLLMEAMKMRNTLYFAFSGKIKKVNIKAGDKIPKGFVIAEYD